MLKIVVGLLTGAIIIGTSVRTVSALPEKKPVCSEMMAIPRVVNDIVFSAGSSAEIDISSYSNTSGCINLDSALSTASLYALSRVTASSVISPK